MPEQFWVLTPGELTEMAIAKTRAEADKEERELKRLGQLAAWLLQPYSKKSLTVDDFIKPPKRIKPKDEYFADLDAMEQEFGGEGGKITWQMQD